MNAPTTMQRTMKTRTRLAENPKEEDTRETSRMVMVNRSRTTKTSKRPSNQLLKEMAKSPRREEIAERRDPLEKTTMVNRMVTPTMEDKPIVTITKKVELDTKVNVVVVREDREAATTTMKDLRTTKDKETTMEATVEEDLDPKEENRMKDTEVIVKTTNLDKKTKEKNLKDKVEEDALTTDVVVDRAAEVAEAEEATTLFPILSSECFLAIHETCCFWQAKATL